VQESILRGENNKMGFTSEKKGWAQLVRDRRSLFKMLKIYKMTDK